jgi:two-component system sensor histidine kinase BaeS
MMDIVDAAIAAVTPAAEAKGVAIRVEKPQAGLSPFVADGDRLRQALWNLLSNAVKFTPA